MLNAEISQISGVGKYRERHFKRLGLHTAYDMLCYFPRSYEDRSTIKRICDLIDGKRYASKQPPAPSLNPDVRRGLSYQKVTVTDNTGLYSSPGLTRTTLPKILTCPQNIYITEDCR